MKLKVLDLFAGIGGFSLGLERTGGFETVAFCEIDKKAQAVLRKHWPEIPIYNDVKELNGEQLRATGIRPDVITGGFPCQDISLAGRGAGLAGERSGLWYEFKRLIEEIKPQYAIIENVSALRSRGLDQVLGSLTEIGYDAEWHCIPASAVGAPHRRDRIWIVAYARHRSWGYVGSFETRKDTQGQWSANTNQISGSSFKSTSLANSNFARKSSQGNDSNAFRSQIIEGRKIKSFLESCGQSWWATEPDVGRVAHGVPKRVDRLKQLGNAVVPQIPELIGRAIIEHH